ncbi:hypothetical protein NPIL_491651 [Nephila pilipes]|uniref:Uncharacterized protein n=1 Tax=Nephila pilipes TaxID=299642 RepID=A0A8X6U505_NEPPI|nr:hypothetical protein NPIL_491651 [Nephila pilipes]
MMISKIEDILTMEIPPWIITPFDETEEVVLQEELLELSTIEELKHYRWFTADAFTAHAFTVGSFYTVVTYVPYVLPEPPYALRCATVHCAAALRTHRALLARLRYSSLRSFTTAFTLARCCGLRCSTRLPFFTVTVTLRFCYTLPFAHVCVPRVGLLDWLLLPRWLVYCSVGSLLLPYCHTLRTLRFVTVACTTRSFNTWIAFAQFCAVIPFWINHTAAVGLRAHVPRPRFAFGSVLYVRFYGCCLIRVLYPFGYRVYCGLVGSDCGWLLRFLLRSVTIRSVGCRWFAAFYIAYVLPHGSGSRTHVPRYPVTLRFRWLQLRTFVRFVRAAAAAVRVWLTFRCWLPFYLLVRYVGCAPCALPRYVGLVVRCYCRSALYAWFPLPPPAAVRFRYRLRCCTFTALLPSSVRIYVRVYAVHCYRVATCGSVYVRVYVLLVPVSSRACARITRARRAVTLLHGVTLIRSPVAVTVYRYARSALPALLPVPFVTVLQFTFARFPFWIATHRSVTPAYPLRCAFYALRSLLVTRLHYALVLRLLYCGYTCGYTVR